MYTHICMYKLEFERGSTRPLPVDNSRLVARQSTHLIIAWIYENIPDSSIRSQRKVCLDDWVEYLYVFRWRVIVCAAANVNFT